MTTPFTSFPIPTALFQDYSGVFNVIDYGAVGDGSTDDTSAVNLAIAAMNTATVGILYFPPGSYLVSAGLTTITASGRCAGGGQAITGATSPRGPGTLVKCSSATANMFTINSSYFSFNDITFFNSVTPSAGSGVKVISTTQGKIDFDSVMLYGFFNNIDMQISNCWSMINVQNINPANYGLKIQNTSIPDAGDWSIVNCSFVSQNQAALAGIKLISSGGGKIVNTKFNAEGLLLKNCIDIDGASGSSILLVSNCSFENYQFNGIFGAASFPHMIFSGLEFGQYQNITGHAIDISTPLTNVIIDNIALASDVNPTLAIKLTSVSNCVVGNIINGGTGPFVTVLSGGGELDVNAPTVKFANSSNFTANSTVAMALGSTGPAGNNGVVKKWLTVQDSAGTTFYLPCF